jgi:glutathione synthase/RimK-type ligase-like ATP-grasp enzyme
MQQFGLARQIPPRKPRRVAVFFDAPEFDDYPFDQSEFRLAYEQFGALITDAGGECGIVRSTATYRGKGAFDKAWIFDGDAFRLQDKPWEADVLYNKCRGSTFVPADIRMVNPPEFERLCTDKWETYMRFPDFFPETLLVQNKHELAWAAGHLDGDLIVAKPLDGEGGKGIAIASKEDILALSLAFPLLLQQFLDTGGGIPGIAEGMHDLRIFAIRGEPLRCYIRQPKKGSYLANFQQGGSLFEIPVASVPADAMKLFHTVDAALSSFPDRVYAVDMGRNPAGRWQLIELNSKPGLDPVAPIYPTAELFMRRLVDVLFSL